MLLSLDALRALSLLVLLGHAALLPGVSGQYYRQSQAAREREAARAAEWEAARQEALRPIREDWRAFLRCSNNNNCNYQKEGRCPTYGDKCDEMSRHLCRCNCLGYQGTTMNSEVWDECWEACASTRDRDEWCDGAKYCRWNDWDCKHLCTARCRCECAQEDRNQTTSAPAATGSGDSGTSLPETLKPLL